MKEQLLTLILLLASVAANAQTPPPAAGASTPSSSLAEFRTLDVTDGIQLVVEDGREPRVRVEGPAGLRERVRTVVTGPVLRVYLDPAAGEKSPAPTAAPQSLTVYVTSTGLNHLTAAQGAVVSFDHSPTRGGTLAVRLLSGARLTGDVNLTLLDIQLGGGATARVTGVSRNLHVRASERSTFQGPGLRAKRCLAYAANASTLDLTVEEALEAEAVSDADITYRGPAALVPTTRGQGGRIRRL